MSGSRERFIVEYYSIKGAKKIVIPRIVVPLGRGYSPRPYKEFSMPFIRTSLREGTDQSKKQAIVEGIHDALVTAIGMPGDELFNLVSLYKPEDFFFSRTFNGIARTDDLVVVEITMRRGRSDAMKKELYQTIATNLENHAGVSGRDVFIFTHENDYSDWSVGNGAFAMAIVQQRGSDA
jgi:phenylpyruvate tautomerase PptA (4-oxalocrotonate tautomerase family)